MVAVPAVVSTPPLPEQLIAVDGEAVTVGVAVTLTVTVSDVLHPPASVAVAVYIVVVVGDAFTLPPVVTSRPVAGNQLYVGVPPEVAVMLLAASAEHLLSEVVDSVKVGAVPIPTVNVPVLLQLLVPDTVYTVTVIVGVTITVDVITPDNIVVIVASGALHI